MPDPKKNGEALQAWLKGIDLNAHHLSPHVFYNETVVNRYLGKNTSQPSNFTVGAFVGAYMTLKVMALNHGSDPIIEGYAKNVKQMIIDNYELDLPLDDWFNKVVTSEEATREVETIKYKYTDYHINEELIPDVKIDKLYLDYGTPAVKKLIERHPNMLPENVSDYKFNLKGFNEAQRLKDALHDKSAENWVEEQTENLNALKAQEEKRKQQLDEDVKPENWGRINVKESTEKFATINKQDNSQLYNMYAKVRQNAEKRPWYDYLFHPIRTYQENNLQKQIEREIKNNNPEANLDDAFNAGKSYVEAEMRNNSKSLDGDIEKQEQLIKGGYDKYLANKALADKNKNLHNKLENSINGQEKDKQISGKAQNIDDPNKKLGLE